jgi:Mn2+/Fe2+ NRAMP family transporter
VSTLVFALVGRPVKTLILVGAVNGLILPISLGVMLVAANRRSIVGDYRHPRWLTIGGWLVAAAMAAMGGVALVTGLRSLAR